MREFKAGDRVAVYGSVFNLKGGHAKCDGAKATVSEINGGNVYVEFLNAAPAYIAHPKQLRHLKKKVRRTVWMKPKPGYMDKDCWQAAWGSPEAAEKCGFNTSGDMVVEFREVVRK